MSKIEEFKLFVKNNPSLLKFVKNKEMSWQQFYEMYDMYGEKNTIWDNYLTKQEVVATGLTGLESIVTWIKNIDLDKMQESINSVQRVFSVLEDLGNNPEKNEYKPRPIYKHFED